MLTDYPGTDIVEISIFGPGKGESIVAHLGADNWVIVDSCVDQSDGTLPALRYLESIGVDASRAVKMIVATHAHDDHIAGISRLFDACKSAFFVCSQAVTSEEFLSVIEVDREIESLLRKSSHSEYRSVFDMVELRGRSELGIKPLKRALEGLEILAVRSDSGPNARVVALSPSHEAVTRSQRLLARGLAHAGSRRKLSSADPNEFAIALWVEVENMAILLGADLLKGPAGCGWQAVLATFNPELQASLFKISHHGAPNAHHDGVWEKLLIESPVAILAPYRAGRTPRPAPSDRTRICTLTPHAHICASPDKTAQSRAVNKAAASMSQLARNVREPWGKPGQVRARAKIGSDSWTVDMIPPARRLCN
ncbi:MAG TPA: MBL fold metallo-hydrolase [Streptosporangiaceae bacterium]|nr:MBL fold metallo-hydrolase [Streptosporangiaceae bacterium]